MKVEKPEVGDILILTTLLKEKQIKQGQNLLPCYIGIEFENDYCWLIRYKDSDQCTMIKKSDERYFFKESK